MDVSFRWRLTKKTQVIYQNIATGQQPHPSANIPIPTRKLAPTPAAGPTHNDAPPRSTPGESTGGNVNRRRQRKTPAPMFPRLPKVFRIFYMGVAFLSVCSFLILRELSSRKKEDLKMARLSSLPAKERQEIGGGDNNNNIKQNDNNDILNMNNPFLFNGMSYRSARGGSSSSQSKQQVWQLQQQPDDNFDLQTSLWNQSSLTPGPSLGLPYNFSQIINPSFLCATHNFVIVYIHTAPNNFKRRMAIRQTWGAKDLLKNYEIRLVFVMGVVNSIRVMEMVKLESDRYNDIMQSDFRDSYRNLSFKAMVALRWIAAYCHNITYILKTDDDILVNIFLLAKQLNDLYHHNFGRQDFIMCNVWTGMRAIRDRRSKWFVPRREFPRDTYPSYCSGSAFVMSPDLTVRLLKKSLTIPFFWIDDVYVTGVLVKAIGLKHVRFNSAYVLDSGKVVDRFFKDTTRTLVFYHVRGYNTMYTLWQKLKERMNVVTSEHRGIPVSRTPGPR